MSRSGMGRNVHSLMLSIQYFLSRPRRRPRSNVTWRMVLERLLWRVTCPNHAEIVLTRIREMCQCSVWPPLAARHSRSRVGMDLTRHRIVVIRIEFQTCSSMANSCSWGWGARTVLVHHTAQNVSQMLEAVHVWGQSWPCTARR